MIILDPSGKDVPLGQKLGGGGEAEIFEVSDQPRVVAKIYRKPTRFHESKLQAMIASLPIDPTLHLGHATICWPTSLLYNQSGTCAGFLMPRVDTSTHVPALKIYNPKDRQGVSLNITWKYIIRTAGNIASAVEAIHLQHHVIGDFNESNILVANNALVTLVDCDSMQVHDPLKGVIYRCLVGKPDFTPPELQGYEFAKVDRCAAHDNFGLAVIIFLLLMEGTHPFNGVWRHKGDPPVLEERIGHGISPYAGDEDVSFTPSAPPFEILPPHIVALITRCFKEGHRNPSLRPPPAEWKTALAELEENLAQCPDSVRHLYSNHLPVCPWCERKVILGGIDPYPIHPQQLPSRVPSAHAGSNPAPADPSNILPSANIPMWRRPRVKRLFIGISAALFATLLWLWIRNPLKELWMALDVASIFYPPPVLRLTPLTACTGLDSTGAPVGISDTFTLSQVQKTGIMVILNYSNAIPQKNSFQVRWKIEGKTYESTLHKFEQKADFIHLNLGKSLPAGSHTIEFLVDGKVEATASITILPSPDTGVSTKGPRTKPPAAIPSPGAVKGAAEELSESAPADVRKADSPPMVKDAGEGVAIQVPPEKSVTYKARHWHGIGSCSGDLTLTSRSIEFTSEQHAFKYEHAEVRVHDDALRDPRGKDWRFSIQGLEASELLDKWRRGELFPGSPNNEVTAAKSPKAPEESSMRIFKAKHKHRFGSCQGELKLTGNSLEFSSPQHYVKYDIQKVVVDGDGVDDQSGRSWHFEIPGEDAGQILRLWKGGKIFNK